jgi:hypothetical protein
MLIGPWAARGNSWQVQGAPGSASPRANRRRKPMNKVNALNSGMPNM